MEPVTQEVTFLNSFFEEYLASDITKLKSFFRCKFYLKRLMQKVENDLIQNKAIGVKLAEILNKMENLSSDPNFLLDDDKARLEKAEDMPEEIHEYLSNNFTTKKANSVNQFGHSLGLMIKSVMSKVIVDKSAKKPTINKYLPVHISTYLNNNISNWDFDIFALYRISEEQTLTYVFLYLMNRHNFIQTFHIDIDILAAFLKELEATYNVNENDYDNSLHACDVTLSLNFILEKYRLFDFISAIQAFGVLFSSIVHAYADLGLPNSFLIQTAHPTAILYNDISVRENYNTSAVFKLMNDKKLNFFSNTKDESFQEFRKMVIDNCISMDLANHAQTMKQLRAELTMKIEFDRAKIVFFLLHVADMSYPAKETSINNEWTKRWEKQLLKQAKTEKQAGLPVSAICQQKYNTSEVQLGIMVSVIEPMFTELNNILEVIHFDSAQISDSSTTNNSRKSLVFPWNNRLLINKRFWTNKQNPLEQKDKDDKIIKNKEQNNK